MSTSRMKMEPRSGLSRPIRDFRNTDLPVPDGPSRTDTSPGGRVSVTSDQISCLPNDLVRSATATSTPTRVPFLAFGRPTPAYDRRNVLTSQLPGGNAAGSDRRRLRCIAGCRSGAASPAHRIVDEQPPGPVEIPDRGGRQQAVDPLGGHPDATAERVGDVDVAEPAGLPDRP